MAARRTSRAPTPARARAAAAAIGPVRRMLVAWLAILGLVVQLSAAAACTMGSAAEIAAFPICHGQGADDGSTRGGDGHHAPSQQAPCPFCALHCHVALASPPAIPTMVAAATVTTVERQPASPRGRSSVRVCAAASPRGPPRA